MCEQEGEIKELRISVPWGFLAGKSWGDERNPIVLCLHGISDNAGAFNGLVKYLPKTFYYIAVDLPGHGRSSHFPPHLPITSINYILVYKVLIKHFERSKYTILGHSYGGQLACIFAQLHPEYVEKLIIIDSITLLPIPSKHYGNYLRETFEGFLSMEEKLLTRKPPRYTYEEAIRRIRNGRMHEPLNSAAGAALAERCLTRCDDGRFSFTTDQRLKFVMNPLGSLRYVIECFKNYPVRCPTLIIFALDFKEQYVYMRSVITFLEKQPNITLKYVNGNHNVHNNEPDKVAPYIIDFLIQQKGKI